MRTRPLMEISVGVKMESRPVAAAGLVYDRKDEVAVCLIQLED